MPEEIRVAVCQEWITTLGGSELVAAELAAIVEADVVHSFTADPRLARDLFGAVPVRPTVLGRTKLAREHWQWLLPIMALSWRSVDLSEVDLVVTSSHACTNSTPHFADQVRVSYCHTPMRYAWFWREELQRFPALIRAVWPLAAAWLRYRDRAWSRKVDVYVANSTFTARRIEACFGRRSTVVHPPVALEYWTSDDRTRDDYFLLAGRMVAYKQPDLAVRAANDSGRRLLVAGGGPLMPELRRIAGSTVEFVEDPTRGELRELYRSAQAIVYPQVEEFGMTLVEAAGCGTPAIARRAGGALDTVVAGETGVFFDDDDELAKVMATFDADDWDRTAIRRHALRFDKSVFEERMRDVLADAVASRSTRPDRDRWADSIRRS